MACLVCGQSSGLCLAACNICRTCAALSRHPCVLRTGADGRFTAHTTQPACTKASCATTRSTPKHCICVCCVCGWVGVCLCQMCSPATAVWTCVPLSALTCASTPIVPWSAVTSVSPWFCSSLPSVQALPDNCSPISVIVLARIKQRPFCTVHPCSSLRRVWVTPCACSCHGKVCHCTPPWRAAIPGSRSTYCHVWLGYPAGVHAHPFTTGYSYCPSIEACWVPVSEASVFCCPLPSLRGYE
jgi:hypothetical protein